MEKLINKRHKIRSYITLGAVYVVLSAIAVTMIYPYLWMIGTSFKSTSEVVNNFAVYLLPKKIVTESYSQVFSIIPYLRGLANTAIIEIVVILFGTFSSTLAAFAFAKMRFPGKDKIFLLVLSGMMVPYIVVLVPQYSAYTRLGLVDTLWPLLFSGMLGNVGMMFFLVQFLRGIPNQLFEAAKVDGASYFRQYIWFMLPLCMPAIGTQVIFWFLHIWNDVLAPDIYLKTLEHKTLQVMLKYLDGQRGSGSIVHLPVMMAGAVLASLPVLALYLSFQKYFVNSMVLSGIKE